VAGATFPALVDTAGSGEAAKDCLGLLPEPEPVLEEGVAGIGETTTVFLAAAPPAALARLLEERMESAEMTDTSSLSSPTGGGQDEATAWVTGEAPRLARGLEECPATLGALLPWEPFEGSEVRSSSRSFSALLFASAALLFPPREVDRLVEAVNEGGGGGGGVEEEGFEAAVARVAVVVVPLGDESASLGVLDRAAERGAGDGLRRVLGSGEESGVRAGGRLGKGSGADWDTSNSRGVDEGSTPSLSPSFSPTLSSCEVTPLPPPSSRAASTASDSDEEASSPYESCWFVESGSGSGRDTSSFSTSTSFSAPLSCTRSPLVEPNLKSFFMVRIFISDGEAAFERALSGSGSLSSPSLSAAAPTASSPVSLSLSFSLSASFSVLAATGSTRVSSSSFSMEVMMVSFIFSSMEGEVISFSFSSTEGEVASFSFSSMEGERREEGSSPLTAAEIAADNSVAIASTLLPMASRCGAPPAEGGLLLEAVDGERLEVEGDLDLDLDEELGDLGRVFALVFMGPLALPLPLLLASKRLALSRTEPTAGKIRSGGASASSKDRDCAASGKALPEELLFGVPAAASELADLEGVVDWESVEEESFFMSASRFASLAFAGVVSADCEEEMV
jgi:hypothetical protein